MDTLKAIRPDNTILMYDEPTTEKAHVPYLIVAVKERTNRSIIVVTNHSDDIMDIVLKEIDPVDSGYLFFQSELEVDPINNLMVPEHRLATREELEMLRSRKVRLSTLPVIKMVDPIRRWWNFAQNEIIAVDRKDGSVYFRRVS